MASQDWFDKDFYKVLGVSKDVSEADLKKTYRKLARKYHPDSNPGDKAAESKFKEISEAYSVLSDKAQREEYDQIRAMGSGARFAGSAGGGGPTGFEDVFGGMFTGAGGRGGRTTFTTTSGGAGGYEDIFSSMFGGGAGGYGGRSAGFGMPTKGRDSQASTTIDFVTATKGETVQLQASGGKVVSVRIPAGVRDGQKIRLKGKGSPSPDGGEAGDLIITVTVRPHPVFERDGLDLRVTVPITFPEAVEGGTIEVPTLGGDPVKLRVTPGTSSGKVLRVKGRGVKTKTATGDLLARVEIVVPQKLNDKQKKAVHEFAEATPAENPRADLLQKAKAH